MYACVFLFFYVIGFQIWLVKQKQKEKVKWAFYVWISIHVLLRHDVIYLLLFIVCNPLKCFCFFYLAHMENCVLVQITTSYCRKQKGCDNLCDELYAHYSYQSWAVKARIHWLWAQLMLGEDDCYCCGCLAEFTMPQICLAAIYLLFTASVSISQESINGLHRIWIKLRLSYMTNITNAKLMQHLIVVTEKKQPLCVVLIINTCVTAGNVTVQLWWLKQQPR